MAVCRMYGPLQWILCLVKGGQRDPRLACPEMNISQMRLRAKITD